MTSLPPITEADLHAFVYGQLPPKRQSEVQAHLSMHAEDARRLAIYRDQKLALHALFDPVLDETIPARMHPASQTRPRLRQQIAAAFAIALISGAAGWAFKDLMQGRSAEQATALSPSASLYLTSSAAFVQRAAMAHAVFTPEVKRPVAPWWARARGPVHVQKR
jgi:anti-sigma factor RsiW